MTKQKKPTPTRPAPEPLAAPPTPPTPPTPPKPPSVVDLISPSALGQLRAAYSEPVMIAAAGKALTTLFPKSAGIVDSVLAEYQGGDDLAPRDRERCIIALLAAEEAGRTLAVHLYWGMMEGIEPIEIANTLLLVGAYAGIPRFAHSIVMFRDLLKALNELAAQGGAAVLSPNVLATLLRTFP